MQVRSMGHHQILLILSAAEAQMLGIPTNRSCALLLRTHTTFAPGLHRNRCYGVRMPWQVWFLETCSAALDLLAQLALRQRHIPCRLYRLPQGYGLLFRPACRDYGFLLRLAGEFGTRLGIGDLAAAQILETGTCLSTDAITEIGMPLLQHRS